MAWLSPPGAAYIGMEGKTETVRKLNGKGGLAWLAKNMVWLLGMAVGIGTFLWIYGGDVLGFN